MASQEHPGTFKVLIGQLGHDSRLGKIHEPQKTRPMGGGALLAPSFVTATIHMFWGKCNVGSVGIAHMGGTGDWCRWCGRVVGQLDHADLQKQMRT